MQQKFHTHFGVYGVCIQQGKVLCIEKNAGPYQNRYDLSGGSQENGEGLIETLKREFLEETGFSVQSFTNNRIYDVFVKEEQHTVTVHHLFALYDVELSEEQIAIPQQVMDGENDSSGIQWVKVSDLTIDNASPLVIKVIEEN
jgi:8-oxo-dGTP pyrophosphatase MutT (NUDIX family)